MSRIVPTPSEIPESAQFVYVVTSGEYSDYSIDAVFSTQALAQAYIDLHRPLGSWRYNESYIEEWPLNTAPTQLRYRAWVELKTGESCREIEATTSADGGEAPGHVLQKVYISQGKSGDIVCGMGPSPEAALQSARDHRARILAEREGIA